MPSGRIPVERMREQEQSEPRPEPAGNPRAARGRSLLGLVMIAVLAAASALVALRGPFRAEARDLLADASVDVPRRTIFVGAALGLERSTVEAELEPVVAHLEALLHHETRLSVAESPREIIDALARRELDMAVLPSLACVQAREWLSGLRLLALQSHRGALGWDEVLVVAAGGTTTGASDLRGARLCAADVHDTSYLAALSWMRSHGLELSTARAAERFVGTQQRALAELEAGRCDAAATSVAALAHASSERFRILATTAHLPTPCWLASPRLDEGARQEVAHILLRYEPPDGELESALLGIDGFSVADGSSLRAVRLAARLSGMLAPPADDSAPGAAHGPRATSRDAGPSLTR